MIATLIGFALIVAGLCAAFALRAIRRRARRLKALDGAATEVRSAMDGGMVSDVTGEALLQHLDGLRRECKGRRDG